MPIPGTTKLAHFDEDLGALQVDLSVDDLREIEEGYAAIPVQGARSSEDLLAGIDEGAKLGTRSL